MGKPSMFDLGEAGYPELNISRQALPFADSDVGDTFKLVATVKLTGIAQQGNTYRFQVRKVGFSGRMPDVSTVRGRKQQRARRISRRRK